MKHDTDLNSVQAKVRAGKLKLCRGYAESMIKSCKVPRDFEFKQLLQNLKGEMSPDSMSIFEFIDHHTLLERSQTKSQY